MTGKGGWAAAGPPREAFAGPSGEEDAGPPGKADAGSGPGTGAAPGPEAGAGPPLLKFCGLRRSEDALRAEALGADLAGFVFHPPSPRYLAPPLAAAVDTGGLVRVGVFVGQGGSEILEIMEEARLDLAQFHGQQTPGDAARVGPRRVVRVVWPERHASPGSLEAELAEWRDASRLLLFDAGLSGGGHGRPPAAGSLGFLEAAGAPVVLAGGLGPDALAAFPDPAGLRWLAGLDLNSGVESAPGVKDHGLMALAAERALALRVRGRAGLGREDLMIGRRP